MRVLLSFVVMAALGGAAQAETRLNEGVSLAHGTFSSGGGLTVATELRRRPEGGTALCGTWSESAAQTSYTIGEARRSLDLASVYVDGRRIAQDLGALPKIAPRFDYAGAPSRCLAVELPWRAGRVPEVFFPRRVIQPGNYDTGGNRITFVQGGAGAMNGAPEFVPFLRRQIGLVPLSAQATVAEGRYSSGGGLRAAVEIVSVNGRPMLCGAWSNLPRQVLQTEELGRAVLGEARVRTGSRVLSVDLAALRRVPERRDYAAAQANCLEIAGARVQPGVPLRLDLPARVVYRSTTPEGRQVIRFSPTPS